MTVLCNKNDFVQALIKHQREKHAAQTTSLPSLQSADDIVDAARSLGMSKECCTFFQGQLKNCNQASKGLLSHKFKVYLYTCTTVQTITIL